MLWKRQARGRQERERSLKARALSCVRVDVLTQWRELCVRFDKTVSVIRADDDGEWAEQLAPTLLSIAIILARLPRARRSGAELDLWASHLGRELLCPARLDQLRCAGLLAPRNRPIPPQLIGASPVAAGSGCWRRWAGSTRGGTTR